MQKFNSIDAQLISMGLLIILGFASCQTRENERLKSSYDSLHNEFLIQREYIKELNSRVRYLEQFEPDTLIRSLSDSEIIKIFLEHHKFYNGDKQFKNLKVKRLANNIYDISYLAMDTSGDYYQQWQRGVSRLTLFRNDEFKLTLVNGPLLSSP